MKVEEATRIAAFRAADKLPSESNYHDIVIAITIIIIMISMVMISMMLAVNRSLEQLYYLTCALRLIGRDPLNSITHR